MISDKTQYSSYQSNPEGPRPGSAAYIKGQKRAVEEVAKWHERFGWGTDVAHAAAYSAASFGYAVNQFFPEIQDKTMLEYYTATVNQHAENEALEKEFERMKMMPSTGPMMATTTTNSNITSTEHIENKSSE